MSKLYPTPPPPEPHEIKRWLRKGGYTYEDAAELMTPAVSPSLVRAWTVGRSRPRFHHAALIRQDLADLERRPICLM